MLHFEPLAAAEGNHVGIQIDATGLHAHFPQEREELAAATTNVEDRRLVPEVLDIRTLALTDELDRPAHATLESEIVRKRLLRLDRGCSSGRGDRRRRRDAASPLQASQ